MLNKSLFIEKRTGRSHLSLDGKWFFADAEEKVYDPSRLSYVSSATLPKSVAWCLYEAGVLPHPYEGINSKKYEYIRNRVWYFKKNFFVENDRRSEMAYLCFDGISYYSRIWLNGVYLGEHEGMFGGPVCEVSDIIAYGEENELIVEAMPSNYRLELHPEKIAPFRRVLANDVITPWQSTNDSLTQNGDFSVVGIWRSVRIEFLDIFHITNPYLHTVSLEGDKATLLLEVPISMPFSDEKSGVSTMVSFREDIPKNCYSGTIQPKELDNPVTVSFSLTDDSDGKTVYCFSEEVELTEFFGRNEFEKANDHLFYRKSIDIASPKLWYPNGYGNQPLYTANITLLHNGMVCDKHSFKTGIRTIKVTEGVTEKLCRRGEKFQFVVNGREIFLKGMNLTELDQLYLEDHDEYDWTLSLAKNEGIGLVRVWNGGGVPESDIFYELCDKYGLMVWQDGYIANGTTENWNVDILRSQLTYNLCRTRNHPSLAVFCAGNEFNPYTKYNAAAMFATWDEYDVYIPDKIFYRTTPDGGSAHIYNDMEPTWYRHLYKHVPFVGESGIHSFPSYKTLKRVLCEKELQSPLNDIFSDKFKRDFPEFINHFSEFQPDRVPRMLARASHIIDMRGVDVKSLVEAGHMASYEFYLIMIESILENYPKTTGIMPWVFKRPWPTSAIQIVDAYGHPQSQYYAVKRAYEPIHPFVCLERLAFSRVEKIKLPVKVYSNDPVCGDLEVVTELFDEKMNKFFADSKTLQKDSCHLSDVAEYVVSIPDSVYDAYFFVRVKAVVDGKTVGESFYYPKVLSCFDDEELYKKEKETVGVNMFFENGPFLKEQITGLEKAKLSVVVSSLVEAGRKTVYQLDIENLSDIPAFPVKIDTVSDISRCMCDDNVFFLDKGEKKKLCVTVDRPSDDCAQLLVSGWNFDDIHVG